MKSLKKKDNFNVHTRCLAINKPLSLVQYPIYRFSQKCKVLYLHTSKEKYLNVKYACDNFFGKLNFKKCIKEDIHLTVTKNI